MGGTDGGRQIREQETERQSWQERLPADFCARMRRMLGEAEYGEFLASYETPRAQALRCNPLKMEPGVFAERMPWRMEPVPWEETGFYYGGGNEEETEGEWKDSRPRPGKHPYHEAGLYYIQEPSAMAVAALSGAQPGERVLDLCAAPGGKTTQIAGRMRGEGLLIANEIHPARARILSQNVERMGIRNAIVTNESPEKLAARFPVFFDRILVDAPCSGEGMFRKEEQALLHWSEENVALCARRQQEILEAADRMLCDGGTLVYSTCTFAPEENEGSVWRFLLRHPEYTIQEAEGAGQRNFAQGNPGWLTKEERSDAGEVAGERPDGGGTPRHAAGVKPDAGEVQPGSSRSLSEQSAAQPHHPDELARTVRLWPHCVRGEGHFIAVLHKAGTAGRKLCADQLPRPDRAALSLWEEFCGQTLCGSAQERLARSGIPILFGEELYLMPEAVSLDKLRVLRPGLHLGTIRRKRFEPSHALALALREEDAVRVHAFSACGPEPDPGSGAVRFLKGETITCDPQGRGWTLVLADGYPLGWGKANSGILKNHYPKGLRWQ